ncbi:MAG: ClpX C4-type zinc finger protein [Candidatus Dormibacteraceae bacterium]
MGIFGRRREPAKVVRHRPCCSFCGKPRGPRLMLIGGSGVYICSECVSVASEILRHKPPATA